MPWGRLDDTLYDHPKLDTLGKDRLPAIGLWLLCISWSNRHLTDGLIPKERIVRLGGTVRLADALVTASLFDATTEGYFVHDFLSFNMSRKEVEEERRSARERMAAVRANKSRTSEPVRSTPSSPVRTIPVYSVPGLSEPSVDTQKMTDEEQRAAYVAAMAERTGVS